MQAGICSFLVQAGLDRSSPYVQLTRCWKIEQLLGQCRQRLGIFQFPTFMWLRQVPPPSQPLRLTRLVITIQTLNVALATTTTPQTFGILVVINL